MSRALRENATRGALTAEQPQLLPVLLNPSSVIVDTLASRYGRRSSLNFTTTGWIRHVSLPPRYPVQISSNNFPPFISLNPIFSISARPEASLLVPLHSITPPTVTVSSRSGQLATVCSSKQTSSFQRLSAPPISGTVAPRCRQFRL